MLRHLNKNTKIAHGVIGEPFDWMQFVAKTKCQQQIILAGNNQWMNENDKSARHKRFSCNRKYATMFVNSNICLNMLWSTSGQNHRLLYIEITRLNKQCSSMKDHSTNEIYVLNGNSVPRSKHKSIKSLTLIFLNTQQIWNEEVLIIKQNSVRFAEFNFFKSVSKCVLFILQQTS